MAGQTNSGGTSKPLNAKQREQIYQSALKNILGVDLKEGGTTQDVYNALPGEFTSNTTMPQYQGMAGGDYDRLEQSIATARTAPLSRFEKLERERVNQDLADRNLYESGVAVRAQGDVTERLAPQYTQAGAEAATQRYGLESEDVARRNAAAQAAAAFELEKEKEKYGSKWRPVEYLSGIYSGTGGNVSVQNASGWSV